jgi:hypothetical protein
MIVRQQTVYVVGEKVFTDLRKAEKAEQKFAEKNSRKIKKERKKELKKS